MKAPAAPRAAGTGGTGAGRRAGALVWIDSREAVIVRWAEDTSIVERLASDVPAHRRSTGHVRHEPLIRHGGGGAPQSAGDPRRIEHLDRFVEDVAGLLAGDEDILLLGPGTVHERLEARLRELDASGGRTRVLSGRHAAPLTERQLVAQLREHLGASPRRQRVGG